jgi:hypothetical protein
MFLFDLPPSLSVYISSDTVSPRTYIVGCYTVDLSETYADVIYPTRLFYHGLGEIVGSNENPFWQLCAVYML